MKREKPVLLIVTWLLLIAAVVFAVGTLFPGGLRLVSGREHEMIERYSRLEEVRLALEHEYYQETDEAVLIQGAIDGMTAALEDEYTLYYTPEDLEMLNREMNGEYTGVGLVLQLSEAGMIEIMRVYPDAPAAQAGLQAGDIVLEIDGVDVSGIDMRRFESTVAGMRGESGSSFDLVVERGGERISATLTRQQVAVSNINACMLEGGVGYIDIVQFGGDAADAFHAACEALSGAEALVIDVRNNPGGRLDDVLSIADALLDGGMIVYMEHRDGSREEYHAEAGAWDVPLAVLVNGASASASEILAAAVQDHGRGAVIGETTYGKGVAQALITFESDGAGLQYTMARYFTPSGRNIHQIGVEPDICVLNAEDFVKTGTPDVENDAQLACALEYLQDCLEKNENDE